MRIIKIAALLVLALQGGASQKAKVEEDECYGTKDSRFKDSDFIGTHSVKGVNPECIYRIQPPELLWVEDTEWNNRDAFTSHSGRRTVVTERGDLRVRSRIRRNDDDYRSDHSTAQIIFGLRRNPSRTAVDIYANMPANNCPDLYVCSPNGFSSGGTVNTERTFWQRVQGMRFWHFDKPKPLQPLTCPSNLKTSSRKMR